MLLKELKQKKLSELYEIAKQMNIEGYENLKKEELIRKIIENTTTEEGLVFKEGLLDIIPEGGYGFLRLPSQNFQQSPEDIYVSPVIIKKHKLKEGDMIAGFVKVPKENEKYHSLVKIETINDVEVDKIIERREFEKLTPFYPTQKINLEIPGDEDLSRRIIDLFIPIGKGQRGLIVSPPRAGKTILLQKIAQSIVINHPEIYLIILLIDERPEEVTDMKRLVPEAEIYYSTFDQPAEKHAYIADIVLERAKRLAEMGKDVVILLDSLTRFSRAHNVITPHSGRTMTGGLDAAALIKPKKFFGSARNLEEGGSLTIIATALIETGSRMDDVIYEEFKGTGNMEIVLDRRLADRRIFPAIDLNKSGTRREEFLLSKEVLEKVWTLRKAISSKDPVDAMEFLINKMKRTNSNKEFLELLEMELKL
ncbi:MAG: transcription termination factor Rho [candidate division WOR-3 bacterium]|nr:transcription termination factor Rho [candidate division WOR-3 bacterium]MCX7947738.1 transcription termination factor Rho [candidate division WOR-3 bacterium]MDW8150339.1 transcription termination factor Rho [candidate division WOR-3 bacterium]